MDEKSRELTKKFKSLGVKIVETGNVSENSGGVNNSGIIVGDVHIGVTAEELVNLLTKQREAYVAELEKYTTDKKVIAKSIEELIDDRLVTKVAKRIFESYNDHYKKNLSDSDFKISIKELAEQSGDIAKDIKDLFKNVQRNGNVIDEIKERLETNQEELNFQIKGLCSICEEMRYYVQQLKQCENNGIKLDNVKLLITKYMEAAELRDKQLLSAIQQVSNNQAEFFSRLDINTMAEMFDVVKDISEQVKNGKQVSDIVSEYTLKLDVRIEKMEKDIAGISSNAVRILNSVNCCDEKLDRNFLSISDLKCLIKNQNDQLAELRKEINGENTSEKDKTIKEYEEKITKLNDMLEEMRSNGKKSELSCPYCGCVENDRYVINGRCECSVCGHRFVDINPTVNNKSNQEIKDDVNWWREKHSAMLEQVSPNIGNGKFNLYRMKLNKDTVSGMGVLIIPDKTFDNKKVSKIAFCQPNTDDKNSQERLSRVETLFFESGLEKELSNKFDKKYPFSEITGLRRVMCWNSKKNCYEENNKILLKIKGEAAK